MLFCFFLVLVAVCTLRILLEVLVLLDEVVVVLVDVNVVLVLNIMI